MAQQAAQQWPQALLEYAFIDTIGSEQDRLELALTAISSPRLESRKIDASRLAQSFGIDGPAARARLLASLLTRQGSHVTDGLLELGLMARQDLALDSAAWHFELDGRPAAYVVAKSLLEYHEPDPMRPKLRDVHDPVATACAALDSPGLREADRIELARQIAQRSDSDALVPRIKSFASPGLQRELSLTVAQHGYCMFPGELVTVPEDRMSVATAQLACRLKHLKVESVPGMSADLLAGTLALGDSEFVQSLKDGAVLFAHGIRTAGEIDARAGLPMPAVHAALATNFRPNDWNYRLSYMEDFFRDGDSAVQRSYLQWQMEILMTRARATPDEKYPRAPSEWVLSTTFALYGQEPAAMDRLMSTIEWLGSVRQGELRTSLTHSFTDGVNAVGADTVARFVHSEQFHRPHMRAFAVTLCRLYPADAPVLAEPLRKVLSHSKLKDGKHLQGVSRDLLAIVGSGALRQPERRRLIELSAPTGATAAEAVDGFMKTLTMLATAMRAVDSGTLDRHDTAVALSGTSSHRQLELALDDLARRAMPGSSVHRHSESPEMRANWDRFLKEHRRPEALLAYAESIRSGLRRLDREGGSDSDADSASGDPKTDLLGCIDQLADAVVWSADKRNAFASLRYDTEQSVHLAMVARRAPTAWAAWREGLAARQVEFHGSEDRSSSIDVAQYLRLRIVLDGHLPAHAYPSLQLVLKGERAVTDALHAAEPGSNEHRLLQLVDPDATASERAQVLLDVAARFPAGSQFRRDLEHLKGLLDAKSGPVSRFNIVDTDDAEDLLLCGTEITGSCQSVVGDFGLNKALMGYVVDGKYRMLAAKDDNGRLAARRMLRLMLTTADGKPALLLERLYANAGIQAGDPADAALIDLARAKAAALGCSLLSDGEDLSIDDGASARSVISLGSRAPYEYVDARGLGVQDRKYEVDAWPVR